MTIKLLHIGLPKCGSTFLQTEIFPKIGLKKNIKYFDLEDLLSLKNANNNHLKGIKNLNKRMPENFILSSEMFVSRSGEFSLVEEAFGYIKNNFSKDTIILLVLRNPYEYLNSIYIQSIHHMEIIKPEDFFYCEKNEIMRKNGKFNLYDFDYQKLINLYKSYFENVVVVKYENLHDFEYLKKIFKLDDKFIQVLKSERKKIVNKSFSLNAIKTIFFINRFVNVEKFQNKIKKNIYPTSNLILKIRNRIFSQLLFIVFFQKYFDRIFPYKKFYLNKKIIPLDIDQHVNNYENIQ